jgi:hypothetical protein
VHVRTGSGFVHHHFDADRDHFDDGQRHHLHAAADDICTGQ